MSGQDKRTNVLPVGSEARKAIPLARGCLDYFPAALAAVAEVSRAGNDKHNPGQPLHHSRGKSSDHPDCILRHLIDRGKIDPEDGLRHSAKLAWRALANLQEELEAAGAPLARGAWDDSMTIMEIPDGALMEIAGDSPPPVHDPATCAVCKEKERLYRKNVDRFGGQQAGTGG